MSRPGEPHSGTEPANGAARVDDPRVIAAVEEYLAALEAGREPDRAQFLARYPAEVTAAVARCLDGLELVHTAGRELEPPAADPRGMLGDFRILREVGRGGMGIVYEAEQISLRRRVALKVLSLAGGLDVRQLRRFHTEAQAAAALHHTNIAPVYAVGQERGVHYYAMQFIDGPSLAAAIADRRRRAGLPQSGRHALGRAEADPPPTVVNRPVPEAPAAAPTRPNAALTTEAPAGRRDAYHTTARLGIEAAEALDHAHQQGVVHRDVKPANLLLDGTGRLWVVDFGLARLQSAAGVTVTGDLVGTLRYMSPEQALARRAVIDHRTDVYSLGATLYELLTLAPAFPGDDRQDVLRRIAEEEPPAPRRLDPAIPADLETIVLKAMAKEPSERYATAQDLADDLRRFLEDRPIAARRPSPAQRARRWARRHLSLVVSLGTASALLLAGLVVGVVAYAVEQQQSAAANAHTKQMAQASLYQSLLKHARAVRLARRPGYRAEVWDDLRRASVLDVPARDPNALAAEALACLGDPIGLDPVPEPDVPRAEVAKVPEEFWQDYKARPETAPPVPRPSLAVASPGGKFVAWKDALLHNRVGLWERESRHMRWAQCRFGAVYGLAFDAGGARLATACETGFEVWDVSDGKLLSLVGGGNVYAVAFHPSGRLLAAIGREVELWSSDSGRPVAALAQPAGTTSAEFSADGQMLLAISGRRAVLGWPVRDTPEKRALWGHGGAVPCVAFSPDGRLLATASKDRTVQLWDAVTGERRHVCRGHSAEVEAVAFSPDGRLVVSGDFFGQVIAWNPATGEEIGRPFFQFGDPPGQVWRLQFDAAGKWLFGAGEKGVAGWAIDPGPAGVKFDRQVALRVGKVYDLAVHPSGSSLALLAPGPDGTGRLSRYDLGAAGPSPLAPPARLAVRTLGFVPSGRQLLYAAPGDLLGFLDWETGAAIPGPRQETYHVAMAPGGRRAALAVRGHGAVIYDVEERRPLVALPPEESDVWGLAWNPDGSRLALGLSGGGAVVWDLGQVRARLAEYGVTVLAPGES